ncbi:MAG: HDIG domain-containing protein, partial [Desulfobacteraceae bacterium]|nr:HDIG domain-containing protein [Desulfobacteraceae bacterium]
MIFETIINQYYEYGSTAYTILIEHSRFVARKSLELADRLSDLNPDMAFIEEAAMLHDIGIFMTDASSIGCMGDSPYLCHGFLGRKLLDDLGLDERLGLVCERHTGAGITKENI